MFYFRVLYLSIQIQVLIELFAQKILFFLLHYLFLDHLLTQQQQKLPYTTLKMSQKLQFHCYQKNSFNLTFQPLETTHCIQKVAPNKQKKHSILEQKNCKTIVVVAVAEKPSLNRIP